jgi:hypothetical protein
MKKYFSCIAFILIVSASLISCSSGHKISGINLNGNWVLNSVTFEGMPADTKFTATVFDDVSFTCFNGSIWSLPNNGNGSYTISTASANCNAGVRNIYWSVVNSNGVHYLQFKHTDGVAAKTVTSGYQLQIVSATNDALVLKAPIDFEGKTVYIDYGFVKQ